MTIAFAAHAWSQNAALDQLYEVVPNPTSRVTAQQKLTAFIDEQRAKKARKKTEAQFLHSVVNNVHSQFLRNYKPYVLINEPFENGNYDCLTGTALFSLVFNELGIQHKIIETNYHIFLMIEGSTGEYLLETTDKLFGLKTREKDIEACLERYRLNQLTTSSPQTYQYHYKQNLFKEVLPSQLKGLLFFNQAVVAFNLHDLPNCVNQLEKAKEFYNNPRVFEVAKIASQSVSNCLLSEKEKYSLLSRLALLEEPVIASLN